MTLEGRRLTCVRGHRELFADLTFTLCEGESVELRGANGSGKTSLLRMLCGLLPPSRGVIFWNGVPVDEQREAYLASLAYVGHRPAVKDDLTTLENLRVSAALGGTELTLAEACDALRQLGLGGCADVAARCLSEGQRRRLALARLVASPRPLWLLDEVFTSLDEPTTKLAAAMIDAHVAQGGIAVVATHHTTAIGRPAPRRIELAA
jgi:heme exporter protein A